MNDKTKGECEYSYVSGVALKCHAKEHYAKVCFFQRWCAKDHKPLNTVNFARCPVREQQNGTNN